MNMTAPMVAMISGMLAMGFFVASTFFYRFWRRTRDTLFAYFAASFFLLGVQRVAAIASANWLENTLWLYLLRLLAFTLIVAGIVAKNRPARDG
ncbi:MAG TPA: DUF5985 family protein [Gemmatimonadaceae bacterium]|nr:DUF5985 family protein [Gemmatimonadaceae bacterium]